MEQRHPPEERRRARHHHHHHHHRTHTSIRHAIERLEREQQQQQQQQQQREHTRQQRSQQQQQQHHALVVYASHDVPPVDRRSWEYLVTYLEDIRLNPPPVHGEQVAGMIATELELAGIRLPNPSDDGSLQVLCEYFSRRSHTTLLTKVTLHACNFGNTEDASQLLTAFQTNRTVTDLTIDSIRNVGGAALGTCLSALLQNMPQLQRLDCKRGCLRMEGVCAFQRALQTNRTLKQLYFSHCFLGDEGARLIANALVGNTTMELLDMGGENYITSAALDNITHMIESTQLKTLGFAKGSGVFNDADATQRFVSTLQHKMSTVQELVPEVRRRDVPGDSVSKTATVAIITNGLARNQQLNLVNLLLAPLPLSLLQQQQQQQQQRTHAGTMMRKVSHKAIAKFANVLPRHAVGASAIFKLFQARPALLEKRIQRPPAAATAAAPAAVVAAAAVSHDNGSTTTNSNSNSNNSIKASSLLVTGANSQRPAKRRRLRKYKVPS
jgi:hypothetical protein